MPASAPKLKFEKADDFQAELRRRVDAYFRIPGHKQRDCPAMYRKAAVILAIYASAYLLLVFYASAWWQAALLAVLLGLTSAGIGFNIQHDGAHRAFSDRPWVNKLMSMTLDMIGGSSFIWHWKHDIFHHTYVNIAGHDADIDLGFFGRLSPYQRRYWFHRWQHLYLWPMYGFLAIKWLCYDDFRDVIAGRVGEHRIPRPKGWDWAVLLGGKAAFFALAFGLPLMLHPLWAVAACYGIMGFVTGITLSLVFQVVHVVEEADFPLPQPETGRIERTWAVHQAETTVDYARGSRAVTWLVGALNFQIEHHLFPLICHVNYPALSKLVEATCADFGVRYAVHGSYGAGLASHYRWLRRMGRAEESGPSGQLHAVPTGSPR